MSEQPETIAPSLPSYKTARKRALFFGLFGADRFYIGDQALGTAKLLLTIFTLGIYCVPWWIADNFIITSHKHDWEKWLTDKQERKEVLQARKAMVAKAQIEGKQLMEERTKKGLCTACGSDRMQIVPETYSKTTLGTSSGHISFTPGVLGTREVVKTRMVKFCLSCGFKKVV